MMIHRAVFRFALIFGTNIVLPSTSSASLSCDLSTVKGVYLYRESGLLNGEYYAESGRATYDGNGSIDLIYTSSEEKSVRIRGSYSVNSDCTGTEKYEDGSENNTYLSPSGNKFSYTVIQTTGKGKTVLSGMMSRASSTTVVD